MKRTRPAASVTTTASAMLASDRQLLALLADPRLGAPAARGRRADAGRDQHEQARADQVVPVGLEEESLDRHRQRGGEQARARPAVPDAQDDGGQRQEQLRALAQRQGEHRADE